MTPAERLKGIRARLLEIIDAQMKAWRDEIISALSVEGIIISQFNELTKNEKQRLNSYFKRDIHPILTPQAVDPSYPFPYISGGSLELGLMVKPSVGRRIEKAFGKFKATEEVFIRLKIPPTLPRLIPVGKGSTRFILVEDLIAANISLLIEGAEIESCHTFRVMRKCRQRSARRGGGRSART